jgi:hypothetical protein
MVAGRQQRPQQWRFVIMIMKTRQTLILALLGVILFGSGTTMLAQGLYPLGGRSLHHVNTAWVQDRGQFSIHTLTTCFYQTARLAKSGTVPEFVTYWDVQSSVALHFATGRHLELSLIQLVYQDTHRDNKGTNLPDDLFVTAKMGSYGGLRSKVRVGFMAGARIPLAQHHNVIFEPYSAGSVELGLLSLLSYSSDVLIPENAFNFHLNLGFWHHNDVGKFLVSTPADTFAVLTPSRELLWGIGFAIPSHQFDYSLEVFGRNFLARPPVTAYSREDYIYLTPGVTYHPIYWAALSAGFDLRLSSNEDQTLYVAGLNPVNLNLPSHPKWRVRLGARFALNRPAPPPGQKPLFTSSHGRLVPMNKNLEKQLNEERRKTETAEDELQTIREERKRMETMLSRLRNLLHYGSETPSDKAKGNRGEEQNTEKAPAEEKADKSDEVTKKNP